MTATHGDAKILIVDDQEANIRLLERILRQGGYGRYHSVLDSRQALAVYQEFQPDPVLLDLMMPHLDGVAVLQQLRPLTEGTYRPVLVLTADVSKESQRRALAEGAKDFLTKPFDALEVLLRIHNLLETRFLYQQLQQHANHRIQEQAALLDRANDAIMVRDMQDRILFWNHGAERLYGWTAEEAVGQDARSLLYRAPAAEPDDAGRTVLREGTWAGELRQVTRDGRDLIVASHWTLVRGEQGQPKSQFIINTDITEKKKLAARLEQAQRLESIGALAGGVAHDFNNLLTIILGYSDLALAELGRAGPLHEALQQVRDAGQRAAGLTRQLLAFSRQQVLAPVELDLNGLVRETEKMLRRLIGEDIALTTNLEPALGIVKADPAQMGQVLMNLVVNARDAMPTGGQLIITTRNMQLGPSVSHPQSGTLPGAGVLLMVRDTGCGMDQATRERLFEPFFTTKEVGKGTGLGLATVYGIVRQSGGTIEVDSEAGQGSTFKIILPCHAPQLNVIDASPAGLEVFPRGTGTLLLVEDEDSLRTLSVRTLRAAGYTVLEARDGLEALRVFEQGSDPIVLLVTDVVMPKMSGRQLAERVAVVSPSTKVLYMTGYTDHTVLRHGVQEAGVTLLHKPFTPSTLATRVHKLLGN